MGSDWVGLWVVWDVCAYSYVLWMMYGLFWIACGLAGWGFGSFVLLVCDGWLGCPSL